MVYTHRCATAVQFFGALKPIFQDADNGKTPEFRRAVRDAVARFK